MTTPDQAAIVRAIVDKAPPLNPQRRLRLAALLRPDLPVGIQHATTVPRTNGAEDS